MHRPNLYVGSSMSVPTALVQYSAFGALQTQSLDPVWCLIAMTPNQSQ